MDAQNDERGELPVVQKSEEDMAENAEEALSYLKRTDNMDLVDELGLFTYHQEAEDEQATEDQLGSDDCGHELGHGNHDGADRTEGAD